ncbi:MAG: hypothetical protein ACRD5H_08700, partial [Nitrososphaerales archaeon]
YIPDEIEAQQGYGVCVRDAGQLRRLWVDEIHGSGSHPDADRPQSLPQYNVCFEAIPTTTGLYLGSRDTEPRLVVLGRLKLSDKAARKRYMNFLNIHLTTLKGEREGNIRRDRLGSKKRLQQLNLILDDILSAYQETTAHRVPRNSISQEEDIWIMAGDFNATPNAEELELVGRVGFVDGNSDKKLWDATGQFHNRIGTKWSSSKSAAPPIVVDYIMCGLQDTAFPMDGVDTSNSLRPYRPLFPDGSAFEPDHAVLFASFEVRS